MANDERQQLAKKSQNLSTILNHQFLTLKKKNKVLKIVQ